jgi:magnesium transporter
MEGESSAVASPFPVPNSSKGHEMEMTKSASVVPEMTSSSSMPNLAAAAKDGNTKVLPFEFRALEVCLESACRSLEEEVCACTWIFLSDYLSSIELCALACFYPLYWLSRNYILGNLFIRVYICCSCS